MRVRTRTALIVAVAAVAVSACAPTEEADDLRRSGVGILAIGCGLPAASGSGVVMAASGQVVTVAHTLRGASEVTVIDADGTEHPAAVIAFDKDADVAVLSVATLDAPPLELGTVATGSGSALVWSRDDGIRQFSLDITKRLAVTIEDIYGDGQVRRSAIEVLAVIDVGDSGGPIVDESDEIVGIIYANSLRREGVGFAVDATEIERVLANVDPGGVSTGPCP